MYIASNLHELVITMYLYDIGHVITKSLHGYVSLVNYGESGKLISPLPLRKARAGAAGIHRGQSIEGSGKSLCVKGHQHLPAVVPTLGNSRGWRAWEVAGSSLSQLLSDKDWDWCGPFIVARVERWLEKKKISRQNPASAPQAACILLWLGEGPEINPRVRPRADPQADGTQLKQKHYLHLAPSPQK